MSVLTDTLNKHNLRLTVVRKMVIGFASLAILLVITSALSYVGLSDIKTSAEDVAFKKMPIQASVSDINEKVLNLARITTNAYFEGDANALQNYKTEYDSLYLAFQENVSDLSALVSAQNSASLDAALQESQAYLTASQAMFKSKAVVIASNAKLIAATEKALNHTDEASALMLDLSYLESDSPDLDNLIGMSTNIDNKLGIMLSNIKELSLENDPNKIANIIENLDYSLSNIKVDVDYARRVAENIDDQGILDMFDAEYVNMQASLSGDNGMFGLKNSTLDARNEAAKQRTLAVSAITTSIESIKALSKAVNTDALQGQENILDAVQSNVIKSLVISVIGIIATATLAFIATRSIAKPLKVVNKRLRILSQGDLSHRLDESGNDEFSELAQNINQLIESLHTLIGSIYEKEANLRVVTIKSIDMGDKSLQQVAEQQQQIDTTSSNTQKVKMSSQNNMLQIKDADGKIAEAIEQSDTVVALVEQSTRQVAEQAEQAKLSTEIVHRLGENSNKIGSILDVIKTIAEQTNLLALNAAIEAARAGEQGRGFAVVADEVRTLATRTHNSTEEIEKMIASLQQDSQRAVEAMNQGSEQVQKGVEITHEVTSQVGQIKTVIESLALVNKVIVQETQDQDGLLDDVVSRLNTIVELSKESAISTQASNEATHEIEEQMNALRDAVGKFKLS